MADERVIRDLTQAAEAEFTERCELVCGWLCSKECVLLCQELCGPPVEVELPDPREFADVLVRITADEELVERLANTVLERDPAGFRALVAHLKIERFAHLLCHWVCAVRCRLSCNVLCSPTQVPVRHLGRGTEHVAAQPTSDRADPMAQQVSEALDLQVRDQGSKTCRVAFQDRVGQPLDELLVCGDPDEHIGKLPGVRKLHLDGRAAQLLAQQNAFLAA